MDHVSGSRCFEASMVLAVVLSWIGAAHADDAARTGLDAQGTPAWLDDERPARLPEKPKRWYGWQTLTTDAVAFAAIPVAVALGPGRGGAAFAIVGGASYTLGAPIVHAAHGRWAAAVGSFGLRVLPYGLSSLAMLCWKPFSEDSGCPGFETLAAIATLLPVLLDPIFFAYDTQPAARDIEPRVQLAPWVTTTGAGLAVRY